MLIESQRESNETDMIARRSVGMRIGLAMAKYRDCER